MSEPLHRLVYYSHNCIAGGAAEIRDSIRQILEASRRNNARVGVTGALMFSTGYFAQVLEGRQSAVEDTFERIQQDARHGEVLLLSFEETSRRNFEDWSMAFIDRAETGPTATGEGPRRFEPSQMTGDQLLDRLRTLMLEEERNPAA